MWSIFDDLAVPANSEQFRVICERRGTRIERIVSSSHASPEGFWYDQTEDEWVVVIRGGAVLRLQDPDETIVLNEGDQLLIAAHRRHRVERTDPLTIWLVVFFGDDTAT